VQHEYFVARPLKTEAPAPSRLAVLIKGEARGPKATNVNVESEIHFIASGNPCRIMCWSCGDEYRETRHSLGLTITVARQHSKTVSELSFLTAVHTAKGIGKHECISGIYACNSSTYSECTHVAETDIRDGA